MSVNTLHINKYIIYQHVVFFTSHKVRPKTVYVQCRSSSCTWLWVCVAHP